MAIPKIWPKQEKKEPEYFVRFFQGGFVDESNNIVIAAIVDEAGSMVPGCRLLVQGVTRCCSVIPHIAEKAGVALDRTGRWEETQCFDTLFSVTTLVE